MISRIPKSSYGSQVNAPEGLSKEEITLLFETINRHSKTNPWKNTFTKIRNELLILWLYHFGARKGELLSLKISDINFKTQTFDLVRRADDSKDSRINQPLLKTRERRIAIPEKILTLTRDYIINHRSFLPQAKKHEFLFVASKSGLAMSLDSVNKIFSKLKETYPDSFIRLSPHVLRHTWNDNFSSIMEKNNISEAEEKKIRSYLMGWSETSNSAETYTKRHTRQKGNKVILNMGNQLLNNFHLNNKDKI
jgi:integrase